MYEKYLHALTLMQSVLNAPRVLAHSGIPTPAEVAWDDLFTYVHEQFAAPDTARAEHPDNTATKTVKVYRKGEVAPETFKYEVTLCKEILYMPCDGIIARLKTIPPVILDVVWPVALAAAILRSNTQINHRQLTTFREFFMRYCDMILEA